MDVKVNKEVCIGCGLCTSLSAAFQLNDEGLAEYVGGGDTEEAKESCPVQAIEEL